MMALWMGPVLMIAVAVVAMWPHDDEDDQPGAVMHLPERGFGGPEVVLFETAVQTDYDWRECRWKELDTLVWDWPLSMN